MDEIPWSEEIRAVTSEIAKGKAPYHPEAKAAIDALKSKLRENGMSEVGVDRIVVTALDGGMGLRKVVLSDVETTMARERMKSMQKQGDKAAPSWGRRAAFDPMLTTRKPDPARGELPHGPASRKEPKTVPMGPVPIGRPRGVKNGETLKPQPKHKPRTRKEGSYMERFEWAEAEVGLKCIKPAWLFKPQGEDDGTMVGIFYRGDTEMPHEVWRVKRVSSQAVKEQIGTASATKEEAEKIMAPIVEQYRPAKADV